MLIDADLLLSLSGFKVTPSADMLSKCFNSLFSQLQLHRVQVDILLQTWLALNEDPSQEDGAAGVATFDPSRTPTIPINPAALGSLLSSLSWMPQVPVSTWVLAFHCLTMMTNLKCSPGASAEAPGNVTNGSSDRSMAALMVADPNLTSVLLKFLMGTAQLGGPSSLSQQHSQIGPTAVKAFHDFLVRLQAKCADDNEHHLKELLLKLVYQLATDRYGNGREVNRPKCGGNSSI